MGASHIRNTRIEGWNRILLEQRHWWNMGTETLVETSFCEPLKNVPRQKKPMEIGKILFKGVFMSERKRLVV